MTRSATLKIHNCFTLYAGPYQSFFVSTLHRVLMLGGRTNSICSASKFFSLRSQQGSAFSRFSCDTVMPLILVFTV